MDEKTYSELALRTAPNYPQDHPDQGDVHGDGGTRPLVDNIMIIQFLRLAAACGLAVDVCKRRVFYGLDIESQKQQVQLSSAIRSIRDQCNVLENFLKFNSASTPKYIYQPYEIPNVDLDLLHATMGMFTESAELAEALLTDNLDIQNVVEEMGDGPNWYANLAYRFLQKQGITREQIRAANHAKLFARFPEKFTQEAAVNRNVPAELEALDRGASDAAS